MHSRSKGRSRGGPRALHVALALGFTIVSGAAHALSCEGLASVTPEASTVTSATIATPPTVAGQPVSVSFCRVQGVARPTFDSEIKWEVWLPLDAAWTGRMKVNGTGGYAGGTPYNRLAQDIGDGFVTAGSNMGHDGGENPTWTLGHPEKVKDWGLRAHYYVATAAKTLSSNYYGTPVRHSYFEGCSNGGRQAMMMAQNYPELFDGIVPGAPSMFYPDLLMWLLWSGKTQQPIGPPAGPLIPDAKRTIITQKVLAQCDGIDGLVDGQITNPRMCHFDIDTLGPSGDGTLTATELAAVKKMYAGTTSESGQQRYTGAQFGSEADWIPLFADSGGYGPFIGHYVYSVLSPPYNWRTDVNFSDVYDHVKTVLSPVTAAPSPDIRAFVQRGGKLVHMHGWNDSVVPPEGSVAYYYALAEWERMRNLPSRTADMQIEKLTPQEVAGDAQAFGKQVHDYHRLFLLPATAHCGGSTGPNSVGGGMPEPPAAYRDADHHVVSAVIKWVEQGVAPDRIIAAKFDASGHVTRSRPVCAFPAQAVYAGSGDINDASNFACETPKLSERDVSAGQMVLIQNSLRQRALILPNR
ncbi:MAG TPA: tannase/feruloyl esterase family alpha/beta hydrolase [Usitatibacter sp.]|jgi:feruloyl esterase|nr:tannase/feruloyl esterase family alpha/beta hydrolase [Usitatibacter sp.]